MHGGERDKTTKLLHKFPAFAEMELMCSGDHEHKPWGAAWTDGKWTFATAEETQYPLLLASRVAKLAARKCK
eukprot:11898525-Karenia_brevis.AAC.1